MFSDIHNPVWPKHTVVTWFDCHLYQSPFSCRQKLTVENVTTLKSQALLNEVNCAWYGAIEDENKREMREILLNIRSPIGNDKAFRISSHCNLIMEALERHKLPPRIDSKDVVSKVFRYLMDRMENKVEVKRQVNCPRGSQAVMNTLCWIAQAQGWNEELVARWNSLPFRILMKEKIKRTAQWGNIE